MRECIICGGGNSVREAIDGGLWNKIQGREIWSVNYAFMTMPYLPTRELWCDRDFFKKNIDALQNISKQGVQCHTREHNAYINIPEIKQYKCTRDPNNKSNELFIGQLGLSGFFALHLAVKEEYERIFLLGYDFGEIGQYTHYYEGVLKTESEGVGNHTVYKQEGNTRSNVKDFEMFTNPSLKSKIYNVSMISFIPFFEKITYEQMYRLLETDIQN